MKNYQLIFWSLRFHGKLFFKTLYVDVKRIWQPEDGLIKMRWTVHGIPRVPWEAEGTFDGISTYRLDSHGKIYDHSVDNILLRDPPMATNPPLLAGLNLQPLVPQQPVPGAKGLPSFFICSYLHLLPTLPSLPSSYAVCCRCVVQSGGAGAGAPRRLHVRAADGRVGAAAIGSGTGSGDHGRSGWDNLLQGSPCNRCSTVLSRATCHRLHGCHCGCWPCQKRGHVGRRRWLWLRHRQQRWKRGC